MSDFSMSDLDDRMSADISNGEVRALDARIAALEKALREIDAVEFDEKNCGCSGNWGFDEVKRIARKALGL